MSQVVIKYAATVDLGALRAYMEGQAMDEELPRSAVQVLEVVMRSGVSGGAGWREGEKLQAWLRLPACALAALLVEPSSSVHPRGVW